MGNESLRRWEEWGRNSPPTITIAKEDRILLYMALCAYVRNNLQLWARGGHTVHDLIEKDIMRAIKMAEVFPNPIAIALDAKFLSTLVTTYADGKVKEVTSPLNKWGDLINFTIMG